METNPKGERRCAVGVGPNGEPIFEQFVRLAWAEANHATLIAALVQLTEQKRDMNERIKKHIKNEIRQKNENAALVSALDGCVEALQVIQEATVAAMAQGQSHAPTGENVPRMIQEAVSKIAAALDAAKKVRG